MMPLPSKEIGANWPSTAYVTIKITDGGKVQTLLREGHRGLAGMYERARLFGAELQATSEQGQGTIITFRLPCG
jgi:signal transduction histidine kinase